MTKSIPMRQAVSGHYAGWIQNQLWTWGGCNFPDKPCADGGEKKFYPQAYGASVQIGDGVLFLGGQCGPSSLTTCEFYPNSSNRVMCTPLPIGLDNFAATYYDGTIYIAGGQSFGKPNRVIYWIHYRTIAVCNLAFRYSIHPPDQPCMYSEATSPRQIP